MNSLPHHSISSESVGILQGFAKANPKQRSENKAFSPSGWILLFAGLLIMGSAFRAARVDVMGLLLHPYLIPLTLSAPFVLATRIQLFPTRVMVGMCIFGAMFLFSALGPAMPIGELAKIFSSGLVTVVVALLVTRRSDYIAGVLGLSVAIGVLSLAGLSSISSPTGFNPLEVANKNAFSLYALPPILLSGFAIVRMPNLSLLVKCLLSVASLVALSGIFVSGNRSGWVCAVLIGLMLIKGGRFRGLLLVALFTGGVAYWLLNYADTKVAEGRIAKTKAGYSSDFKRINLFKTALRLSFEFPITGVSPQRLSTELGENMPLGFNRGKAEDTHNLFVYIAASSGWICFGALAWTGWTLFFWKIPKGVSKLGKKEFLNARSGLRMLLILWCARGMFTREILYSPGFCIAMGLAIGLCIVEQRNASEYALR